MPWTRRTCSTGYPLTGLERLHRQLSDYINLCRHAPTGLAHRFTPPADMEETDDAYVVDIELPGVKHSDIDIDLTGRRLTVSGQRHERQHQGIVHRHERTAGHFSSRIDLPSGVTGPVADIVLEAGVLTLRRSASASIRASHSWLASQRS
jgi:HSP20 family protein